MSTNRNLSQYTAQVFWSTRKTHMKIQFSTRGSRMAEFVQSGTPAVTGRASTVGDEKHGQEPGATSNATMNPAAKASSKLFLKTAESQQGKKPRAMCQDARIPQPLRANNRVDDHHQGLDFHRMGVETLSHA